jgi:hypothetical protein
MACFLRNDVDVLVMGRTVCTKPGKSLDRA